MPTREIEEFAQLLVRHVRDVAIHASDALLEPQTKSPIAQRWRSAGVSGAAIRQALPDIIDETVFALLDAIDNGALPIKFTSRTGREIDLAEEGLGELAGWYMGSGGWRARFSKERYEDDFADLAE